MIKPTYVSLTNKALPERGDTKPKWSFQCHDLESVAQTWICWCWSGGAISTFGCSPLCTAWSYYLPGCFTKNGMHYRELYWILCAARRCLKSQEGWSQGWWEAEMQEKNFEKGEGKVLRRKEWKQMAKPMNLVPSVHNCCELHVFLKLKLCAFWRSAAHSVHDNFPTVHCGPIKVYVFEVCGFIASAWIKWFSRKLSFSTIYRSQKWVHKCFVSASGKLLVISVTISHAVLNLRHSCTSPVLRWPLESISIATAWEKKVLGCHKFYWSIASIGWLSTYLNHTFLAKSAIKLYLHQKQMFQWTLCEKMKAFLP